MLTKLEPARKKNKKKQHVQNTVVLDRLQNLQVKREKILMLFLATTSFDVLSMANLKLETIIERQKE